MTETLTQAIALALSEPKGPVHLDLPEDVALAATNEKLAAPARPAKLAAAPDAALARARELIAAAERPIVVLGATAMRLADPAWLRRTIERHNLPFATTTMAKGMIDEDHPLALGCIERACRQVQRRFLRLPISSSASATTRSRWNTRPGSAIGPCCRSISSRWTWRLR